MSRFDVFFVLNGWLNGDLSQGRATTCGFEKQLDDGWYVLLEGDTDPRAEGGPFETRDAAMAAGRELVEGLPRVWSLPDGRDPYPGHLDNADQVEITTIDGGLGRHIKLIGSYEVFQLTLSIDRDLEAVRIAAAALRAWKN